jgi:hypothetical protein
MKSCKGNGVNDLRLWGRIGRVKKLRCWIKRQRPTRKTDVWATRHLSGNPTNRDLG